MNNPAPPLSGEEFVRRFAEIHPAFEPRAALVEANRCLYCFDAPCATACPTHIDVPRFIKKIASGNLRGSAQAILDANILGLSCARVCPVDVLCEGACVMNKYNRQPIEIGRLQRHAMDYFYSRGPKLAVAELGTWKVACVGGGPASLACAAELRRNGVSVTIFDRHAMPGGLNTYGIAEYKLRPADSLKEVELVRGMGVNFETGVEVGQSPGLETLEAEYDAIFLGIGLGPTQALGVSGENLPGVVDALRFIADYKTGTAQVGTRVVVVGAGNTAIDAATAAVRLNASSVSIVYRRSESEMPAFRYEFELAKQDGIEFRWLTQPVAIHGSEAVESVECVRMELGPPDEGGRRFPQPVEGSNFRLPSDMVITALGQSRLIAFLEKCRGVMLEKQRVAVTPETGQTTNPRYFAGGDCVSGGREVVDAAADGKRAARGILAWLGSSDESRPGSARQTLHSTPDSATQPTK
ncbi:MAG TPA: NAD(P)-dependent oxidoreductase [Bryobacteraceae bacterium]|nr:NAD(P)-dependent oxidoreductase [Bryobacteraceae bacterium]